MSLTYYRLNAKCPVCGELYTVLDGHECIDGFRSGLVTESLKQQAQRLHAIDEQESRKSFQRGKCSSCHGDGYRTSQNRQFSCVETDCPRCGGRNPTNCRLCKNRRKVCRRCRGTGKLNPSEWDVIGKRPLSAALLIGRFLLTFGTVLGITLLMRAGNFPTTTRLWSGLLICSLAVPFYIVCDRLCLMAPSNGATTLGTVSSYAFVLASVSAVFVGIWLINPMLFYFLSGSLVVLLIVAVCVVVSVRKS